MGMVVNSKTLKNIWTACHREFNSAPSSIQVPIEDVLELSAKNGPPRNKSQGIGKFKEGLLKFFTQHKSLGLDRATVAQMDKLEGDDFILSAYRFICKNYKLDGKSIYSYKQSAYNKPQKQYAQQKFNFWLN